MLRRIIRVIQFALLPLVGGCGIPVPYVPSRPPVPLITHQGQLDVSAGVHFPDASGFDYQVVYAPMDHVSTYCAFQFDRRTGGTYMSGPQADYSNYNNRFFEFGLGYFDSLPWAHFEAFLLGGFGNGTDHQTNFTNDQTDTTSLSVFRIGIQQNIE